jgi:hypothetical protein
MRAIGVFEASTQDTTSQLQSRNLSHPVKDCGVVDVAVHEVAV